MNPVEMLIRIIPMSKEAAYRRLRGETDFSLEDVLRIVRYFDVSLDRMIASTPGRENYDVKMISVPDGSSAMERYSYSVKELIRLFKMLKEQQNPVIYAMTDILIPVFPIYQSDILSRFFLYKFLYRWGNGINPVRMSDFVVPGEITRLHRSYLNEMQYFSIHYICPPEFILSHVREVRFFHKMNLLTYEEVQLIKEDTNSLLDDMGRNMTKGKTSNGLPFSVFLCHTGFDSTHVFYKSDDYEIVSSHMFGDGFYYFRDPRIIDKMKRALDLQVKNSTLITVSGEKQRLEFLQNQRDMLDTL